MGNEIAGFKQYRTAPYCNGWGRIDTPDQKKAAIALETQDP